MEEFVIPAALLMARWTLGILFLFQAIDKIFNVGIKDFTETIIQGMERSKVPVGFIRLSAFLSSYLELIAAVLLLLGIWLPGAYLLLAFDLVMVVLSFSFIRPLWDMSHVFPRMVILLFLMLMPLESDIFTLSSIF